MTKQEFLAFSLPFRLKMQAPYGFIPNGKESTGIAGIVNLTGDLYADIENNTFNATFKPILHPLSDLTREIEHKGERVVPIVELANKCFNNTFTTFPNIKTFEVLNSDNKESFGFIGYTEDERFSLTFDNTFNNQSFEFWIDGREHYIKQFDLFLKLIEWHFDIAELIESGDAIDVNTLPINPYK